MLNSRNIYNDVGSAQIIMVLALLTLSANVAYYYLIKFTRALTRKDFNGKDNVRAFLNRDTTDI